MKRKSIITSVILAAMAATVFTPAAYASVLVPLTPCRKDDPQICHPFANSDQADREGPGHHHVGV